MKGFVNLTHTNNKKIADLREELNKKQNSSPTANIPLINTQTGKLDNAYIPTNISGTSRVFAGTFGEDGVIVASAYASEINGQLITEINLSECVGHEFSYTGETPFVFDDIEVNKNDLIVCNGDKEPNWTLYDNSDKVVSVNGQTGAVQIDIPEAGIEKLVGTEEKPINLAIDLSTSQAYYWLSGVLTISSSKTITIPLEKPFLCYKLSSTEIELFNHAPNENNPSFSRAQVTNGLYTINTLGYLSDARAVQYVGKVNGVSSGDPQDVYAPTTGGSNGQILGGTGGAPVWKTPAELGLATTADIEAAIGNVSSLLGDTDDLEV